MNKATEELMIKATSGIRPHQPEGSETNVEICRTKPVDRRSCVPLKGPNGQRSQTACKILGSSSSAYEKFPLSGCYYSTLKDFLLGSIISL
jgi:hypothetical protein